jgi:aryl-alcohol dehydrogenase-like predicted oxidoreductase
VLREERLDEVRQLTEVAEELDVTTAQLALAWCLQNLDASTVITGASNPHRVAENTQALNLADKIDGTVKERIEEILDNKPEAEQNWRRRVYFGRYRGAGVEILLPCCHC